MSVATSYRVPSVRLAPSSADVSANLGLLDGLEGSWRGHGFNLIARPDREGDANLYLELNLTDETLNFERIGSSIPNRGFAMGDIELFGLTYLQKISDRTTGGALHIEPGIWVTVPATTEPKVDQSIARMSSIPHGTALLAEGSIFKVNGGPKLDPVNTAPFPTAGPMPPGGTKSGFPAFTLTNPATAQNPRTPFGDTSEEPELPASITQALIDDPVTMLRDQIKGQEIVETVVLEIATAGKLDVKTGAVTVANGGGGIENLPFLERNADTALVFATFWIEKVKHNDGYYMQLQYVQTVMLNFPILHPNPPGPQVMFSWPHVSVATLRKSF
ncbi:MAG: hypothetical protein IAI49_11490, partial [Candidatus Eremiobacteraeota bacterium]|nr:hypothetical protein [Candidatus Eremiobacteraeota bacterium]